MKQEQEAVRIVVVDDEPIIRMDLMAMLKNAGYQISGEGGDGFEAIELCHKHKPDVVLLDIRMEALDGISAARVISEECPETSIILLTGYNKGDYVDKTKDCRISSYLVKPIDETQLLMNIELAVARNKELQKYRQGIKQVNEQLESRIAVDRAKGILMKRKNMTEEQAYHHIREISKTRNLSMAKVAGIILRQTEKMDEE